MEIDDMEMTESQDFDMDDVDDMPQFVNEIEGVYKCNLSLKREVSDGDKPKDNLVFYFILTEPIEVKTDYGAAVDDIVGIRYSLSLSERDKAEGNKESFGLRLAKPHIIALKNSLGASSSLNDIINESQEVVCTATFSIKRSKVKQDDGTEKEYINPILKKLIIA